MVGVKYSWLDLKDALTDLSEVEQVIDETEQHADLVFDEVQDVQCSFSVLGSSVHVNQQVDE